MQKFGLIGKTLKHSFSKNFFTEKFERENIDAQYDFYELTTIDEFALIKEDASLCGLNVTIPYKEQIFKFLDEVDETALAIGAVNTIKFIRDNGKLTLKGYNTDIIGFTDSLKPLLKPCHRKALILGTGGASKAVFRALLNLGITPTYVSRSRREEMLSYDDLNEAVMADYLLIINCSPVGMFPNVDAAPNIPYQFLTQDHCLYDLVYNPIKTLFCKKGEEQGAVTKNGLEMLHGQAIASWKIWNS